MARRKKINFDSKKLIKSLLIALFACLIVIIEINIFYSGYTYKPQKADVIIVLGCSVWGEEPSPMLMKRIEKAYELYKGGFANKIIASGSKGYGEKITEASAIKRVLINKGVPERNIIEENNSTNTVENLKLSKALMDKYKLSTAIIVTNYFHIYRASMIAKDFKINASYGKAEMPNSVVDAVMSNLREILSVVKYFSIQTFYRLNGFFI